MPSKGHLISKLQKKLQKEPNSLIFFQLAEEYRKAGNLDDALRVLKGGLYHHPNYWSARVILGRVHHQMGNPGEARAELEKVVQAVPDNLLANRLLGDIYKELQLPGEALKRYRIVHMLTPANQELLAQIKHLEGEAGVPEGPKVIEEPPAESHAEPETIIEPESQVIEQMTAEPETIIVSEPELAAPTIQIPVPNVSNPDEIISSQVEETIMQPSTLDKLETVELSLFPAAEAVQQPAEEQMVEEPQLFDDVQQSDLFITDSMLLEASEMKAFEESQEEPQKESEEEISEDSLNERNDSEELSSLASLLLSAESATPETEDFDELEPELAEDGDFDVEELMRDPQQDHTQPIQEEEENEQADELTTETLAELYLDQGLIDKAVKVYQRLLLNDPGNTQILKRLKELNAADDSAALELKSEEPVLITETGSAKLHSMESDEVQRRNDQRRRKINTLENWLTTIRRERD